MTIIKEYRIKNNLTQEAVARALDITLNHYQKIEYGTSIPNVHLGLNMSILLNVDPFTLFEIKRPGTEQIQTMDPNNAPNTEPD